ncbi:hypothetical protein AMATHDRAFT_57082 [Amanita thiersii Skay4041]|uniref:Uncharacterized protein n=1 Tax=Amanita thiersii Skay4041 TaxID=703135 RepID=A0A2A9NQS7_9AGAR|nr:hypothetical protein AMATHDRAFT_57082 [Amanita thiersii Skay4041]
MSQSTTDQPRPSMRRKSSAQNLLSSFKSNSSSSPSLPTPVVLPPGSAAPQASTPSASTPLSREWDAQSLHSDGVPNTLGGAGSPSLTQGTSVDILRELVHKRIITLTYLRNIHEGRSHWFHTVHVSRGDLDRAFNNDSMKKRSLRYTMLGMSLSNLLDINSPHDLLRGVTNIMNEFDQAKEDNDKPKMRSTKRFWKGAKTSDGIAEGTYLMALHIPFTLDYHQTLLSLLDVISEVYNKILKMLGPSPFPQSQHYMGPLGLLSPHPGVSYLFSADNASSHPPSIGQVSMSNLHQGPLGQNGGGNSSESDVSNSLWGIANSSTNIAVGPSVGSSGTVLHMGSVGSPPAGNWSALWGDMLLKVDSKIKKITTNLLKELDQLARNSIQDELASLDPLLRNLSTSEDAPFGVNGKSAPEFDGL